MTDTIRQQCLDGLKDLLASMGPEDPPAADPYTVQWGKLQLGPLKEIDQRKKYSCGIVEGTERKQHRMPLTDAQLEVVVEFRAHVDKTETQVEVANRVLGEIQRKIGEDPTLGGIAIDCKEVANEIDYDGDTDKSVEGVIKYMVQYRHATKDPRSSQPV